MTTLAAEIVRTDAALFALRDEWELLWRQVPLASPFLSPAWLLPWWRQFGTGAPRVAVLRDDEGLLGLLPLYLLDEGPCHKLLPVGAGLTDYQDALIRPGAPRDTIHALLSLATRDAARSGATVCDLIDVPPDSRLRDALNGWRHSDPCPVLTLPPSAELRDCVPAEMHRKLRMNRHRAARAGGAEVRTATAATLPAFFDALIALHEARWSGHGVLADSRVRAFHRDAAPLLLDAGLLRLQVLLLQGRIAAACYALLGGRQRLLFYLSGYDAAFAYESPGTLLLGAMLEEAIGECRTEAHFLRGGERYKYGWGAVDRMNAACRLALS